MEIESPHDETWEKMAFYAEVGVREAWVIDRDTKVPRVVSFDGARREVERDPSGWVLSAFTGVEMRPTELGQLALRLRGQGESEALIPEGAG